MRVKVIPRLYLQWLATVDQGKQVEFLEANTHGDEVVGGVELARVFADADDRQWVEFYVGDEVVHVPLAELRDAINYAARTVRSEQFYDRQLENNKAEDT